MAVVVGAGVGVAVGDGDGASLVVAAAAADCLPVECEDGGSTPSTAAPMTITATKATTRAIHTGPRPDRADAG